MPHYWIGVYTYRISHADLHDFVKEHFADNVGATLRDTDGSFVDREMIGRKVGPFGWVLTKKTMVYSYVKRIRYVARILSRCRDRPDLSGFCVLVVHA